MQNQFFHKELSPLKGILFSFLLALFGFLFFFTLSELIKAVFFGGIDADISTDHGLMLIRISQFLQTTGLFLFPAILIAVFTSSVATRFLGFNSISTSKIILSIALMVLSIPGINLIASINAMIPMPGWMLELEQAASRIMKAMLITDNVWLLMANLLVVAVLPAIAEELFFRGLVQKYMIGWVGNRFWGLLITAAIFSAIHMQFQGFIPRLLLGMLFGYLYIWSGSIWAPIAAHFANNSTAVFVYYLIGKGDIPDKLDTIGNTSGMWQAGIFSLAVSGLLLWVFWRERVKHPNPQDSAPTSEGL
jgi:membrane protease YdiL (CAAX protease family)